MMPPLNKPNSDKWQWGVLYSSGVLVALTCFALALFIETQTWSEWFHHPAQNVAERTRVGAELWRIMLAVTGAVVLIAPLAWMAFLRNVGVPGEATALSRKRRRAWGLVGIVFVALLVRATRIGESLWYDEIASWMTYSGGVKTIGAVFGNFLDPINHPFHSLLVHLSVSWLSDWLGVELAFRLPALIFSLLSVVAIYGLAQTSLGERTAFIAAGLAAILPVSALEGVEARGYSMMIFFSAAATWSLLAARKHNNPWLWAAYSCACALGVWAHFVTAFVPIGHAIWMALRAIRFGEWRQFACGVAALMLAAALAITLYSPMIPAMLASRGMFAAVSGDQPTILGPEGLHALLQLGGSWYWWAAAPGLLLLVIGLIAAIRQRSDAASLIDAAMLGLPLMLIVVALSGTWMYARFTLFVLPGAILLLAIGLDRLWRWRTPAGMIACALIAVASVADLAVRPPKQPLRDAADYVRARRRADDYLLVIGLAHPVQRLYAGDLNLAYTFKHGENLPRILSRLRPDWVIVEYPNSVRPETYKLLEMTGYTEAVRLDGWIDWTNGDVIVYRLR